MAEFKNRPHKVGFSEGTAPFEGFPPTTGRSANPPAITATDAKNRFGELLDMARKEPVHVQKNGRTVAVLMSIEQFETYEAAAAKPSPNPLIMKIHEESKKRWGKVYEALAR